MPDETPRRLSLGSIAVAATGGGRRSTDAMIRLGSTLGIGTLFGILMFGLLSRQMDRADTRTDKLIEAIAAGSQAQVTLASKLEALVESVDSREERAEERHRAVLRLLGERDRPRPRPIPARPVEGER